MPLDPARDGLISAQAQLIMMLAARNAGLEQRNSVLEGRVSEMEERLERLERAVSRNSGNSSMPPSAAAKHGEMSSPPSAPPSPETPGCRPSPHRHNSACPQSHNAYNRNATALA